MSITNHDGAISHHEIFQLRQCLEHMDIGTSEDLAIKLDLYTNDALNDFIKTVIEQLDVFQASFQKNSNNLSRPAMNSDFLSDFRKRKEPVEKLKNTDNGGEIQLFC